MFILKLNSKFFFKYPFDSGKKLSLAEYFEGHKIALFCLFSHSKFLSVFRQPKTRVLLYKRNKPKPPKQSLKQHKTARRHSGK